MRSKTLEKNKTFNLTPSEMWSLRNNEIDGGIQGYVLPKEILDARGVKWNKDRADILKNPKKYRASKTDKDGNPVPPPKRPNFLDEVTKWANSFYHKEKAEKTLEDCEGKNHPLLQPPKKKEYNKIEYPKRQFYTDLLIREEKKKYEYKEDKQDAIQDVIEKTKEWESKKIPYWKKVKSDYGTKDEKGVYTKATFGKGTRVTVVSDAEHVGEKYPFYNTYKDPEKDEPVSEFNPLVFILI